MLVLIIFLFIYSPASLSARHLAIRIIVIYLRLCEVSPSLAILFCKRKKEEGHGDFTGQERRLIKK